MGEVKDRIVMFDESKKKCIPSKMEEKSDSNDMESDDPAGLHKLWVGQEQVQMYSWTGLVCWEPTRM